MHWAFPSSPELGVAGALGLFRGDLPHGACAQQLSPALLGLPHHGARSLASHRRERSPPDLDFFLRVKFTRHRTNHFKVNISMACSVFMTLCNPHLRLVPEHLYPPRRKPRPREQSLPTPPPGPGNHQAAFCLCGPTCSGHITCVGSYRAWPLRLAALP